ncbi:MAG TPA: histidine kinase [Saprospiraceae bacterium]|nr:histidine kinase [Saprospiraceae bacterium]
MGNEVFDIIQDCKGYIWFATNHGICKFNGYEFITPRDTSSLVGTEAFVPAEDDEGNIWFGRLDKSIWIIEKDVVRPWRYNHLLKLYKDKFSFIDNLTIDTNGTVWIALGTYGLLVVEKDGQHQVIREWNHKNLLITRVANKIVFAQQNAAAEEGVLLGSNEFTDILLFQNGNTTKIDQVSNKSTALENFYSAWLLENNEILVCSSGKVIHLKDRRIVSSFSSGINAPKIIQTEDGNLLIASYRGSNPGLFLYKSIAHFKEGNGENILPGYLVCDILCDAEGGWWVATRERGILYCKNPDIDVYDTSTGFSSSNVMRLTSDHEKNIYAGIWPKQVWKINASNHQAECISTDEGPEYETWALFYDTVQQTLWRSKPLEYFENDQWKLISGYNSAGQEGSLIAKEITSDPSHKYLWASSTFGFYKIDVPSYKVTYIRGENNQLMYQRTFSITADHNGNIWVATIDGLRIWKDDHYELPFFRHPALRFLVSDLEFLPDSSLAIGFSGGGVLVRRPDGLLSYLTVDEGLSSNLITKVKSGLTGDIYACSDFGLNHLTKSKNNLWDVETITLKQGLPSNLVNDLTLLDNELWVATAKGLVHLKNTPKRYNVSTPLLESFIVNSRDTSYQENIQMPFDRNNITIVFHSLHYRSEGNILYRYRFSTEDSLYTYTTSRQVNFLTLSPGYYKLEIQAQNEDGGWSQVLPLSFFILQPWWKSWWFITLVFSGIVLILVMIIKVRLKTIKNRAEVRNKIKDLEMAALRAQMNPHFIFNCLGSIQQFIAENDSASATRYLARFAKLVRLSLHSSVDGKHSLMEEIEMLDNYLALEQMRFKGKFGYKIENNSILNPEEIFIPPMLVQPFVENAILHGMKNKSNDGLITIDLDQKENSLIVTVSDNGPGFAHDEQDNTKSYKSLGIALTKRRLNILSQASTVSNFTSENLVGPDNKVIGSRVIMQIPVD